MITTTPNTKPIYDSRVNEILEGLSQGIRRDQLAERFGHKNFKTLDIYMRRRNFKWDHLNQTYVLSGRLARGKITPANKAAIIVEMMNEPDFDIQQICSTVGFKDNRQLAEYMRAKGYIWSSADQTYRKELQPSSDSLHDWASFIQHYEPILRWLASNKDRISDWIKPNQKGTLPHYMIPGKLTRKTIQMSETLQDLAVTFCTERNLKQHELFEAALIEFFRKQGYEIDNFLEFP
ncbi:hypothetical protein [Paenibacillus physcomitrellae]|uniref:Uncharacterized protein n=2 Tax=Paenibacillus physcomitrellae TaxID=1619311 RepID=A0ABQ1GHG0_9BACL|nr:hypothetical protein [Paenibacillus physcomitrellae]GGA43879.1 hypothetical protein GCM10010917_31480 [Paenibacillus physcomitrellae]